MSRAQACLRLRALWTLPVLALLAGCSAWSWQGVPVPAPETEQVIERMARRLAEIPGRWDELRRARLKPSGRRHEDVLDKASRKQKKQARVLLEELLAAPPGKRTAVLVRTARARTLTEVDLWMPFLALKQVERADQGRVALLIEAALETAEYLARRDALLLAAGHGFQLVRLRLPMDRTLGLACYWADLGPRPFGHRGAGMVNSECAELRYHAGRNAEATAGHERAYVLYRAAGDEQGMANTWLGRAKVQLRQGDIQAALRMLKKARRMYEDAGNRQGEASTGLWEAKVLFRQDRNEEALDTQERARKLYRAAGDAQGEADTWFDEAEVRFLWGENKRALQAQEKARKLYRAVGDRLGEANTWNGEARVKLQQGLLREALKGQLKARQLYKAMGSTQGEANTWDGEADIQLRQGYSRAALAAHHQARRRYRAVGDKLGEANTWFGEAGVQFLWGKTEAALKAQEKARELYREVDHKLGEANTLRLEADIRFRKGEIQTALETHRNARVLFEDVGSRMGQANTWLGEGKVQFRQGANQAALAAQNEARRLYRAVSNKRGEANTWDEEAKVRFRLRENQAALAAYKKARRLYRAVGDKQGQASTWDGEAEVQFQLGNNQAARRAQEKALGLYRDIGDRQGEANTLVSEAKVLFQQGNKLGAQTAHTLARDLYKGMRDKQGEASTWLGEAEVHLQFREWVEAERTAMKAVDLAMKAEAMPTEINARLVLMRSLDALDRDAEALDQAEATLERIADWRNRGGSDVERTAMADYSEPHDLLVPRLAREANQVRALEHAEAAHAPVLLDLITRSARPRADTSKDMSEPAAPEVKELGGKIEKVQDTINDLRKEQARLGREIPEAGPERREILEQRRRRVDEDIEMQEILLDKYTHSSLDHAMPMDATAMRELVRELGHPVLLYYVARNETVAFLLLPGRSAPRVHIASLTWGDLIREVAAMRNDLATPALRNPVREAERAARLYDLLIRPFASELAGHDRLTIIPHGPLHQLPFAALLVERDPSGDPARDTRLFQRFHLSMAPSLSVLREIRARAVRRKRGKKPSQRFVGLATTDTLIHSAEEMNEVAGYFAEPARATYVGDEATYGAYAQSAGQADYLFLSTHGVHVADSRSGTHLEIVPTDDHDHRLSAREIAQIPLRATLVALSACDTATAAAMASDERLDLTRAFLIGGADTVLATAWKIPDSPATRQFIADFFDAVRTRGLTKIRALTRARQLARDRGDDPQLWAAWVLVGSAE